METKDKIKAVLQKNGVNSIDDLAEMLANEAESPAGSIVKIPPGGEVDKSWVIKIWEIDKRLEDLDLNELPDALGGDILRN